jgi:hypothetical protein
LCAFLAAVRTVSAEPISQGELFSTVETFSEDCQPADTPDLTIDGMLAEAAKREGRGIVANGERLANAVGYGLLVNLVCFGDLLLGPAVYPQLEAPAEFRVQAGYGKQKAQLIAHGLWRAGGPLGERFDIDHAFPPPRKLLLRIGGALGIAWNGAQKVIGDELKKVFMGDRSVQFCQYSHLR